MAVLKNSVIKDTYNYLATIENILNKEIGIIKGNKIHIDRIVPDNMKNFFSAKENKAQLFSRNLHATFYETSIVSLVASFEKVVFAKYKTTYGTIKGIVGGEVHKRFDYYKSRERFVNGNIDKLHSIIEIIEGRVEPALLFSLKNIKEQRDFIAHGKRFGAVAVFNMKMAEIAEILDNVITEIES